MSQGATLGNLVRAAGKSELPRVTVDASDVFDEPVEFVFEEPTLAKLFAANEHAQALRKRRPDWPLLMCQAVAYVAQAHVSPPIAVGDSAGLLYAELADKQPRLFDRLWQACTAAFATAAATPEVVAEREGGAAQHDSGHDDGALSEAPASAPDGA